VDHGIERQGDANPGSHHRAGDKVSEAI